jgi:RNA polymerase sigma-70 factor (sigma-E family)
MPRPDEVEFAELVAGRSQVLRRTAYLLCGDWHLAEDLVQITFTKLYAAWGRVRSDGNIDAYLRKTLVRSHIDEKRRAWWRRESPATGRLPELPAPDGTPGADRDLLVAALRRIPPGQRAVLVLRFWEDQSVEDTARLVGCSPGTVKSQTARGLAALRAVIAEQAPAADIESLTRAEG